jgi:hypothetical protein
MLLVGVEEEMGIPAQSCPSNHSPVVDSATPTIGVSQPMSRAATPTPQQLVRVDKTSHVDLIWIRQVLHGWLSQSLSLGFSKMLKSKLDQILTTEQHVVHHRLSSWSSRNYRRWWNRFVKFDSANFVIYL